MISTSFPLLAIIASCARAAPASSSSVSFSRSPDEPTPSSVVDIPTRLQERSMSTSEILEPTISVTDGSSLGVRPTHSAVPSATSTPTQAKKKLVETEGGKDTGRLIVMYKEGVDRALALQTTNAEDVTHLGIINGAAIKRTDAILESLLNDPDVESVHEDGIAYVFAANNFTTQNDAPWGLQRISSKTPITPGRDMKHVVYLVIFRHPINIYLLCSGMNFQYTYDENAGKGVDVYVIDTGVNINHTEFGGRAKNDIWVPPFTHGGDEMGHGTHCSGIVGGIRVGVAKAANINGVKVVGSSKGTGTWSGVIKGMDRVLQECMKNNRPCVASISLGGPTYLPGDRAVIKLVAGGVHTVLAAGNHHQDVKDYSPARVSNSTDSITVGATGIGDKRPHFSNFGQAITVHAPGVHILSAAYNSNTALRALQGTSMAAPHVSGLIAYWISIYGNMSPAAMKAFLVKKALKKVLTSIPSGTANLLAYNGNGQ
ncbi:peptidase 1 [Flagelloscypha sp. PMI_526]|nr:peptidase 1 [Flagelloscypha sp. PMI_526]